VPHLDHFVKSQQFKDEAHKIFMKGGPSGTEGHKDALDGVLKMANRYAQVPLSYVDTVVCGAVEGILMGLTSWRTEFEQIFEPTQGGRGAELPPAHKKWDSSDLRKFYIALLACDLSKGRNASYCLSKWAVNRAKAGGAEKQKQVAAPEAQQKLGQEKRAAETQEQTQEKRTKVAAPEAQQKSEAEKQKKEQGERARQNASPSPTTNAGDDAQSKFGALLVKLQHDAENGHRDSTGVTEVAAPSQGLETKLTECVLQFTMNILTDWSGTGIAPCWSGWGAGGTLRILGTTEALPKKKRNYTKARRVGQLQALHGLQKWLLNLQGSTKYDAAKQKQLNKIVDAIVKKRGDTPQHTLRGEELVTLNDVCKEMSRALKSLIRQPGTEIQSELLNAVEKLDPTWEAKRPRIQEEIPQQSLIVDRDGAVYKQAGAQESQQRDMILGYAMLMALPAAMKSLFFEGHVIFEYKGCGWAAVTGPAAKGPDHRGGPSNVYLTLDATTSKKTGCILSPLLILAEPPRVEWELLAKPAQASARASERCGYAKTPGFPPVHPTLDTHVL
jgi:hypothetical protein